MICIFTSPYFTSYILYWYIHVRATGTFGWGQLVHFPLGSLGGIGIKKGTFGGNWYMPKHDYVIVLIISL